MRALPSRVIFAGSSTEIAFGGSMILAKLRPRFFGEGFDVGIEDLKRWHWVAIGILLGMVGGYIWSMFAPAIGAGVGAVLIGGLWPLLLVFLIGAGWGRQKTAKDDYDLTRFRPENAQAQRPATQMTAAEDQHLAELDHELEESLRGSAS